MTVAAGTDRIYRAAGYARLSRDDGDRPESDSIRNQQRVIEDYCAADPNLQLTGHYTDDGFTGTNFRRPGFQALVKAIEEGLVDCVVVKDLSRFGRDYIDMGYYLERWFPARGVRFIAVNDQVDSRDGPYDMLLPLKNIFNTQYARDISEKVRSAIRAKQRRGQFVGAFPSYGYRKDPADRNHLVPDPEAAPVVYRIFTLAAGGMAQLQIARLLNGERIPCPSEYKRLAGERYRNSRRLDSTGYWTYATIHRMLRNQVYTGCTVANRTTRAVMHGKAAAADPGAWIVVPGTHEAIVPPDLWAAVQRQLSARSRAAGPAGSVSLFAGLLRCGDCGRAMCRTSWNGSAVYACGSYHRYGADICSPHYLRQETLETLIQTDLNRLLSAVPDLPALAARERSERHRESHEDPDQLIAALERVRRRKQQAYEDWRDGLITREDYRRYAGDYDAQSRALQAQIEMLRGASSEAPPSDWVDELLSAGRIPRLDRETVTETVAQIRVYRDRRLEIDYRISPTTGAYMEPGA